LRFLRSVKRLRRVQAREQFPSEDAMIPLQRSTTKSLGTTLLSYSRQALPRPARLYSTPSTARRNAYLAQSLPPQPELPPYMSKLTDQTNVMGPEDVHDFLKRNASYTLLPPPLPSDQKSHLNDLYFTDSSTQDSLAIIDACLHNHYDIPRAKQVFETLRKSPKAEVVLGIHVYNSLLEAFGDMATSKDPVNRLIWLEDAWTLFDSMEMGKEAAAPNAVTYAIMLTTWLK
jgi:DNA-directed RNA polymerase, mitochondrial